MKEKYSVKGNPVLGPQDSVGQGGKKKKRVAEIG